MGRKLLSNEDTTLAADRYFIAQPKELFLDVTHPRTIL
jgi:hypothetical protein